MATITKKDLVDRIASRTGQRRGAVKDTLQAFLGQIIEELGRGNRIEFRDFGVFEIKERAARTAQNPKTLEPVEVPPKRTVKFKVGRMMRVRLEDERPAPKPKRRVEVQADNAPEVHVRSRQPAMLNGVASHG